MKNRSDHHSPRVHRDQFAGSLRLSPEYGAELPIWGCRWQELGLDPDVLNKLADWQDYFDARHSPGRGWQTEQFRNQWARDAISGMLIAGASLREIGVLRHDHATTSAIYAKVVVERLGLVVRPFPGARAR